MKKILILVIALALVGGVAMAQVTVGGIVEMRTHNNFDDFQASTMGDTRLTVSAQVGDYNTATMRIPARPEVETTDIDGAVRIDRAHVTTNLGALIGTDEMGLGITVNWGWNEWGYADFIKFTGYEFEQVQVGKAVTIGSKFNFNVMGMANVYFAVGMDETNLEEVTNILVGFDTAVDVGVGTLSAELVYGSMGAADIAEGELGFGVKLAGVELADGIALTAGGSYTLAVDSDVDASQWGFGLGVDYGALASLGVSMTGLLGDDAAAQDAEFDRVGVNLRLAPAAFVRFDIGSVIGVADRYENAFDSLDVSTTVNAGRAAFRFGYLYVDEDNTPAIKRDLRASFNPAVTTTTGARVAQDVSGLYIRATLAF